MKTGFKLLVGIMLSPLFLQSCQNDELSVAGSEGRREIVFTSIIDDSHLSRVVDASWEQDDKIGVFMKKAGTEEVIRGNVPYVTKSGNGNFVGENGPMEFPEGEGVKVDFIAYYPYTTRAENFKQYGIDLTNQQDQRALDLMKAVNLVNRDATSPQGNLQFRHLLSKLVLNLTPSQGASLKGIKATVSALKVKGNADLSADGITLEDQTAAVEMFVNAEGTQAEAVLLPQDLTDKLKITLELNGQQREVTTNISGKLEAGKKYICNLKINFSGGGQITPEPEGKYTKWFETPVITDSQLKDFMYITHNTDLKYKDGKPVRNYSMLYDKDLKMAYWVAYPLHACYTTDKVKREDKWVSDPIVKNNVWQAVVKGSYTASFTNIDDEKDYYRRGHQCPSNDRIATAQMNAQTFYFTNQTPQRQNKFNGAIWMHLEHQINSWSSASDTVYVVTGAMPPAEGDTNNPKTVKDNDGKPITVPGYYFKAVARKIGGKYHTIAFKLDHKDYKDSQAYMNYAISVSELEKTTGFTFFPQLDAATKQALDKSKWNK